MSNLIAKYKNEENIIVEVFQDEYNESPRDQYDHLGNMQFFHNRYTLGDKKLYDTDDYKSFEHMINENHSDDVVLPVYMYDHSGLTISTRPFSCQWDSGQLGFIFISKADVIENWGDFTEESYDKAIACLESEVKEYDSYLRGECYVVDITYPDGENDICGGILGDHEEYLRSELSDFGNYRAEAV